MDVFSDSFTSKNINKFVCKFCDFSCSKKGDWSRHLLTGKHKNRELSNACDAGSDKKNIYLCNLCEKKYKSRNGLWCHKKNCNNVHKTEEIESEEDELNDKQLMLMLINQNKELMEIVKNGTHNTNNIHTNSHNKTFNLNMFLNETCKNAMNISDFVKSIQLQLSDLEDVGELGYVNGISNIIIKNLKELDITQRPIHCTDAKREILYVKDHDKWEKENDNREKMVGFVKNVANKNIKMLNEFKNNYPDCVKRESRYSDHYNKLVIEAMGGSDSNNYEEKHEKIIKKISKEVTIDKELL
jgi:hypothetical protein